MIGDGDDDEEIVTGTEGEGTEGSDLTGGNEDGEVSAEHPDDQEDDGQSEDGVDAQPAPTRGQARHQRLANEAKAAREEAAAARREVEELRRAQIARQGQVSEEERQARRALMTDRELMADDMAQMRREMAAQRQQDFVSTRTLMDKSAYDAKAVPGSVHARYRDEVEARFQELASKGQPVEREILLKLVLGERALNGAANLKPKKQAQARVASQRVQPSSGKGDAQSERGKAGDSPEKRLQGVFI